MTFLAPSGSLHQVTIRSLVYRTSVCRTHFPIPSLQASTKTIPLSDRRLFSLDSPLRLLFSFSYIFFSFFLNSILAVTCWNTAVYRHQLLFHATHPKSPEQYSKPYCETPIKCFRSSILDNDANEYPVQANCAPASSALSYISTYRQTR